MARRYYGVTQSNDDSLIYNALKRSAPMVPIPDFGLIIVDEAQDLKPLFYTFVKRICAQVSSPELQMVLLGDPLQRIYPVSDDKYMLHAEAHFGDVLPHNSSFKYFHFTICWRITHEMAAWINENLNALHLRHACDPKWATRCADIMQVWGDGIRANPSRGAAPGSVVYLNCRTTFKSLVAATDDCFDRYGPSGCAVVSRAVNSKFTPTKRLVSMMGHRDWEVLCKDSPKRKEIDPSKYIAASIHRFKGLERDAVVVVGLDAYFEGLDGALGLFNLFYVAVTRARRQLVIAQVNRDPFVTIRKTPTMEWSESNVRVMSVSGMLDFVPYMPETGQEPGECWVEGGMVGQLPWNRRVCLQESNTKVPGRTRWKTEDTTPLYEIALQLALCLVLGHPLPDIRSLEMDDIEESKDRVWIQVKEDLRGTLADFNERWVSIRVSLSNALDARVDDALWWDLMRLANAYHTSWTGYAHRWRQIVRYEEWVDCRTLSVALANSLLLLSDLNAPLDESTQQQRLETLPRRVQFHTQIGLPWNDKVTLGGLVDLTLDGHVVHIHLEEQLSMTHLLQALSHASMLTLNASRGNTITSTPCGAYVMVPNLGLVYKSTFTRAFYADEDAARGVSSPCTQWDAFKFLHLLVNRKLSLPRSDRATLDKHFHAYFCKKGTQV